MQTGIGGISGLLAGSSAASVAETSVSTIYALADVPVNPGRIVYVQGHTVPNDGGEGFFLWNERWAPEELDAGTRRAENALWVRSRRSDRGYWFRLWDGEAVNVRWFGAKGNGEVDDA